MLTFRECLYTFIDNRFTMSGNQKILLMVGLVILCAAAGYLLGSMNFAIIISKLRYRGDIRKHGSGNAGATNMLRTYGRGAAAATLAGDMLKCVAAVLLGSLIWIDGAYLAGLFCVIGHVFPIWHRFKGGKGVASMAVVILMTNPIVFVIMFSVFIIIVASTKYVSLASIMGALLYPLVLNAFDKSGSGVLMAFLMSAIVVIMHRGNIKRLLDKTESRTELFGKKKKSLSDISENASDGGSQKNESQPQPKVNLGGIPGSRGTKKKSGNNKNKSKKKK